MHWKDRIAVDDDVVFGKPHVRGTRLSVEFLLGLLAQGWAEQALLDAYPQLCREDLLAVYALASELVSEEEFVVSGKLVA
ncbi:MAG: DUF433 domain-containing protein [Xanthomonadales bacterium]|nr:hypothetical protein [Xanthomonadales bacterium]MCC6593492.1 DUF433 domain-containing protein [Xanthomonadales bacterium]MCE7930120.1 DUF433 domain-containing protein [Xanthomonadales bacterium PRO6]